MTDHPITPEAACLAALLLSDLYRQAEIAGEADVSFDAIRVLATRVGPAAVKLALRMSAELRLGEAGALEAEALLRRAKGGLA